MFWQRLHTLLLGGSLIAAHAGAIDVVDSARLNELLSYECGRAVAGLVEAPREPGPLFREGGLLFTSIEDSANQPHLVVTAGDGVYVVELAHVGVNRVRFDLMDPTTLRARTYFLSYLHDPKLGSRYLEFAVDQPPAGHFEFDYLAMAPRRAADLLPHLEYAIFATSDRLRTAVRDGRVSADLLRTRPAGACDHLTRESPELARELARNLDQIDAAAKPRAPAAAPRF